jgi:hypothetical protein
MCELGTLQSVDLRCIWPNEAQDFTPWLAEEENLARLAETLNMELELEAQEIDVGNFRADLLCRNTEDNSRVLIENQLEPTDHNHLGQILTYAPGLNVATIVWIAKEFREEHRAALDWQNEITAEHFQFFGLEIQLWKIGDSPPAPRFNIVSKPNNWSRTVPVPPPSIYQRFWEGFVQYLTAQGSSIRQPNPLPLALMVFGIGRTGFRLEAASLKTARQIRGRLTIREENDTSYFNLLKLQKREIENELGELQWDENPSQISSSIALCKNDTDLTDEADWPNQYAWLKCKLEKFDEVFRPRIQGLNAADWQPQDEDDN